MSVDAALPRREVLRRLLAGATAVTLGPTVVRAQSQGDGNPQTAPMDQRGHREVRLSPKGQPVLSTEERDALEHRIACQCGCPLDVYTCRTTDFTCSVSPAMHRDVISLVEGGYSAEEIIGAFETTYGERVLMSPKREGFNWLGYLLPSALLLAGGALLTVLLRRWSRRAAPDDAVRALPVRATDEELARLAAAVRDDSR